MFQQTDGDIDEIIVPIASFDPASTVEVQIGRASCRERV